MKGEDHDKATKRAET